MVVLNTLIARPLKTIGEVGKRVTMKEKIRVEGEKKGRAEVVWAQPQPCELDNLLFTALYGDGTDGRMARLGLGKKNQDRAGGNRSAGGYQYPA